MVERFLEISLWNRKAQPTLTYAWQVRAKRARCRMRESGLAGPVLMRVMALVVKATSICCSYCLLLCGVGLGVAWWYQTLGVISVRCHGQVAYRYEVHAESSRQGVGLIGMEGVIGYVTGNVMTSMGGWGSVFFYRAPPGGGYLVWCDVTRQYCRRRQLRGFVKTRGLHGNDAEPGQRMGRPGSEVTGSGWLDTGVSSTAR